MLERVRSCPCSTELAAQDRLLLHARADHVRLVAYAGAHFRRRRALPLDLGLCGRHLARDVLVLRRNRVQVVELVEHVVEVPRGEQDVDRRRLRLLVDVDQSQVQALHGERVLVLQKTKSHRLDVEQLSRLVQPLLVQLEIGLQRREP